MISPTRLGLHAGWLAGLWFALAAVWLGASGEHFDPSRQPLGDLGALHVPGAVSWNWLGFVCPGALLLVFSVALEIVMHRDGARRAGRLGSGLLMISAVAFAAQGVFPFDLDDPDALASQRHVAMLAVALLGLMAGAALVSIGLYPRRGWTVLHVVGGLLAALLLVSLVHPPQRLLPMLEGLPGYGQRVVYALYFSWFALAALVSLKKDHRPRNA